MKILEAGILTGVAGAALLLTSFVGRFSLGEIVLTLKVFRDSGLKAKVEALAEGACKGPGWTSPKCSDSTDKLKKERDKLVSQVAVEYDIRNSECVFYVAPNTIYSCAGIATPRTIQKYFSLG